jgi:hypothetical protein
VAKKPEARRAAVRPPWVDLYQPETEAESRPQNRGGQTFFVDAGEIEQNGGGDEVGAIGGADDDVAMAPEAIQGSILQNLIWAENFSDKILSSHFGTIFYP